MRRDFCCWEHDEDEVRESSEHLIFAGRGRRELSEAVLCRGPYILVPGTQASGGWEWRGRWSEDYDEGPVQRGSQPKSRPRLMGCSSVMWSRVGELKQTPWLLPARDGGVPGIEAASSQEWWRGERWRFVMFVSRWWERWKQSDHRNHVCVQPFIPEPPRP